MDAPATRKLPKDFLWGFATGMSPFPARARREEGRGTVDVPASVLRPFRKSNGILSQPPFKLRGLQTLMDEESQYGMTLRRHRARHWTERMAR